MDRTSAAELEAMLMATRQPLQALADHVRENVPGERRREVMVKIAAAMAELIDVSRMIYEEFPDLNSHLEKERIAFEMKRSITETKRISALIRAISDRADTSSETGKGNESAPSIVSQIVLDTSRNWK